MPSTDVLESAGRRAALGPVPAPPSIDVLTAEVDRRRTKKRRLAGGAFAAIAVVVALPLGAALVDERQPDVVTLASGDLAEDGSDTTVDGASDQAAVSDQTAAADVDASADTAPTPEPPTPPLAVPPAAADPFAGLNDENFDVSIELGDLSFSIEVVSGDDAASRAADAEARADDTRDVDDQVVWLDEQGDNVAASAFIDGETFVEVTGPSEQIDRVLDLVTEHANGPVQFFDLDGFAERFDLPEGVFDGEGFSFEDGEFPFGGDDFMFEPFFDDAAIDDFRTEMQEFADCMDITVDQQGDSTSIEIPNCELPNLGGLFGGEGSPFGDGELTLDLDDLLEGFQHNFGDVLEDRS